ncbi:hypothetical protein SDC9_47725 [bioreactor metagenome]|uniref:Uncharacterized protein n=1 Tax=bioreactor metagenome TaxID=1076179 RepID=A0A644WCB7_9ZZZZ
MKNVKKGTGKHILLVLLLLIAVVAVAACGKPPVETLAARIRIDYSDTSGLLEEINKANSTQTAAAKDDPKLDSLVYQIIIDGNLGAQTNWGSKDGGDYGTGNGFLDKQCTTYDSLVMLLSEITSGEKAFGYFSCELGEATTVTKSDVASGVLQANYYRYDAAFSSDSLNTRNYIAHKNLACLVSDVAATAATSTESNNVFILVSDLAMQNESVSSQIADVLTKNVISSDSLTMSLIGIQADYVGKINNVPRSSIGIEPKRVFGEPLNSSKVYQRYLYLLIIGNPKQVYETTNKILEKCENNSNLNREGQVNSVYFSGLECVSSKTANSAGATNCTMQWKEPNLEFCGNILSYGEKIEEKNVQGYMFFFNKDEVTQEDIDTISRMPLAKIYSEAPSPTEENIRITCSFPFSLRTCIKQSGASMTEGSILLDFSASTPTVTLSQVNQLDLTVNDNKITAKITGWSTCDSGLISLYGEPVFDAESGQFQVGLVLNNSMLQQDLPMILSITLQPSFMPDRSKLLEAFDASWLTTWSMDMKQYNYDWDTHAFTFKQAKKTAYLAETFLNNLLDRQIDENIKDANAEIAYYTETFVLGVVEHNQAGTYVTSKQTVKPDTDFGWGFSKDEVDQFPKG